MSAGYLTVSVSEPAVSCRSETLAKSYILSKFVLANGYFSLSRCYSLTVYVVVMRLVLV